MSHELEAIQALPVKWTESTKVLLKFMEQVVNLDEVIDRLQATDCQNCSMFSKEQVKFAFLKWIEQHIESIETDPEWFINHNFKHFYRNLPFDELVEMIDLREYEQNEGFDEQYEEHCAEMDAKVKSGDRSQDVLDYIAYKNQNKSQPWDASSLEDDFEGTAEEAAVNAINW